MCGARDKSNPNKFSLLNTTPAITQQRSNRIMNLMTALNSAGSVMILQALKQFIHTSFESK